MHTYSLSAQDGHLFVDLAGRIFLLDTGAPTSFGQTSPLILADRQFTLDSNFMGLTAELLSTYVGHSTDGILGGDILNEFDVLIDIQHSQLCLSETPLACSGDVLPLEFCMNVPIVAVDVARRSINMFFDTGARISYLQDESLTRFPAEESVEDFYPGFGRFTTNTFRAPLTLGTRRYNLRCGQLPPILGMTLMLAGAAGIVGNELLRTTSVGYFPRRKQLILG